MASKQVHKVVEQKKAPVSATAAKTAKDVKKDEKDLKKDEKQPAKSGKEIPKDSKDLKKNDKDLKQSDAGQSRSHGRSRQDERNRSRERGHHSRDRTNHRGQEKEVCRNFLNGRCDRGVLCKFSHPRSNSRGRSEEGRQRSPVRAPGRDDNTDRIVCRDFVRNMCKRGGECRFYHPPNPENKKQRSSWLTFCHDFQNGHCSRSDCRFFHITKQDEDNYRATGEISPHVVDQAVRKALFLDVALTGTRPTCKEFLKGVCNMQNCRFRHLSRREYEDEVFHALQDEFEIVLGPPERQRSPGVNMFRSFHGYRDTPKYGNSPVEFRDDLLGPDDLRTTLLARTEYEPETKRMRHYSDEPMYPQQDDFSNNQRRWDDRLDLDRQDFSSYDSERLMQEIFNLRNDNLELRRSSQQQIMELREELNTVSQENANYRMENSNLRSNASEETISQKSAIEKLIAANNNFMQDNRKYQEAVRKLERENNDMRKSLESKQKAKNSELDRKVEILEKENRDFRDSLSKTSSMLKKVQEEKSKVEQQLQDLRTKLHDIESRSQRKDDHYHNSQGSSRRDDYQDQMSKMRSSHVQGMDRRGSDSPFYNQELKDQDMRTITGRSQDRYGSDVSRSNSRSQYNQGHSIRSQDLHGIEMRGQDSRGTDMRAPGLLSNDLHENDSRGSNMRVNDRGSDMERSRQWSSTSSSVQQSVWPNNKDISQMSSGEVPSRTNSLLGEYQPMNDHFRSPAYPAASKGQALLRTPEDFHSYNNQNMSQGLLDTPNDHHKTDSQFSSQRFEDREYRLGYNNESSSNIYGIESRRPNTTQAWSDGGDSLKGAPGRGLSQNWGRRGNTNQNF